MALCLQQGRDYFRVIPARGEARRLADVNGLQIGLEVAHDGHSIAPVPIAPKLRRYRDEAVSVRVTL
jgi:hypothetical protein